MHTRQFHILIFNFHQVTIFAQLRCVEMLDRQTCFGKSDELWTVDAHGVSENTTSIDDSDRFVGRQ